MKLRLEDEDVAAIAEQVAARIAALLPSLTKPRQPQKTHWKEREAADELGVSHYTLRKWREKGFIAAATAVRPILYRREHIDAAAAWISSRG